MNPIGAAIAYVLDTRQSVFITGKAGTGKTTLLERLTRQCDRQFAVVAPTGVAALRAGGTTIHSLLKIPVGTIIPQVTTDIPSGFLSWKTLRDRWRVSLEVRELLEALEVLFIDEVSMVRPDLLDAVDQVLRLVRNQTDQPFGGVQVIYLGDLFQLPPVYTALEMRELSKFYSSPYFYSSLAVQDQKPVMIELDRVFRQQDPTFIDLLNKIRLGRIDPYALACLNERVVTRPLPSETRLLPKIESIPLLTTHVRKAQQINESALNQLPTAQHLFEAEVTGSFQRGVCPADERLFLKVGARVMMLKNDSERPARFFNGKLGIIEAINNKYLTIQFEDGSSPLLLERETWKQLSYRYSKQSKRIERVAIGSYRQFPVKLAWAITVHKSQGLTFDAVRVDLEGAFAPGQVYVALSRCRSLSGLYLNSAIPIRAIRSDPRLHKLGNGGEFQHASFDHWQSQHLRIRFGNFRYHFGYEAIGRSWLRLSELLVDTEPVWVENIEAEVLTLKPLIQQLAHTLMQFGATPLQPNPAQEAAANAWTESLAQASRCLDQSREILTQIIDTINGFNLTGYNERLVQQTQLLVAELKELCTAFEEDLTEQGAWLTDFISASANRWEAHQAEQEIPPVPLLGAHFATYDSKTQDRTGLPALLSDQHESAFGQNGASNPLGLMPGVNRISSEQATALANIGANEAETHALELASSSMRADLPLGKDNHPNPETKTKITAKVSATGKRQLAARPELRATQKSPSSEQRDNKLIVPGFVLPKPSANEPSQLEVALVQLRSTIAKQERIPPFRVYTNDCLREIVAAQPTSLEALRNIRGMGPKRVAAFGQQILDVITSQQHFNEVGSQNRL